MCNLYDALKIVTRGAEKEDRAATSTYDTTSPPARRRLRTYLADMRCGLGWRSKTPPNGDRGAGPTWKSAPGWGMRQGALPAMLPPFWQVHQSRIEEVFDRFSTAASGPFSIPVSVN
jgi:hypothetical protein